MDWLFVSWVVLVCVILMVVFAILSLYRIWGELVEMRKFVAECVLHKELERLLQMTTIRAPQSFERSA